MMMNESPLERLAEEMQALPLITAHLPGIGGVIKAAPDHFEVEEILPYAPCGEGEHLFVILRRQGWNTADVAAALAGCVGVRPPDVGWGGRKDKHALSTQTFSLPMPLSRNDAEVRDGLTDLPFEIIAMRRHRHKLKTGHVAANRFRIVISQVDSGRLTTAVDIAAALRDQGVPNFYGEQRFGIRMANLERALALVQRRKPARGRKDVFLVSALQGALFNLWLAQRMQRDHFHTILKGDVVQKTDTGGLFVVEDVEEATARFERHAIVYTGPIFGHKMKPAGEPAASLESAVTDAFGWTPELWKRLRAPGSRRQALLRIDDLAVEPAAQGLRLTFTLPAGAYATVITREFTRLASGPDTCDCPVLGPR